MDHLFLDANIIFSAAYGSPGLYRFWEMASHKKLVLLTSAHAVEEARRNLEGATRLNRLDELIKNIRIAPEALPDQPCPIKLSAKDIPVFMSALSSEATHFVTGDLRHFGKYLSKTIEGLIVCTPRYYLSSKAE